MIVGGKPRHPFDVVLPTGRSISMDRVVLQYTYNGVFEGDPSRIGPDHWYRQAESDAIHHFYLEGRAHRGHGISLILPTLRHTPPYPLVPHVPYVTALALCSSWHDAAGTGLALIWFQDSFDEPLFDRWREAVVATDWDKCCIPWED